MSMLKQIATRDMGGAEPYATGRLIPVTEPTGAAYVAWKAKEYSAALMPGTSTGYRNAYGQAAMMKYHKILKRESKTNAVRMAA